VAVGTVVVASGETATGSVETTEAACAAGVVGGEDTAPAASATEAEDRHVVVPSAIAAIKDTTRHGSERLRACIDFPFCWRNSPDPLARAIFGDYLPATRPRQRP
jgi:hypothetical protein